MAKKKFRINDVRIGPNKIYPYYIDDDLEVHLIPISYYTKYHAKVVLENQFGPEWRTWFKLIKGKDAIVKGWKFHKNIIRINGKRHQIMRYYYPAEYSYDRNARKNFAKLLKRSFKRCRNKTAINRYLQTLYLHTL